MLVRILCLLAFAIPIHSQTLDRYSYRREVTVQTLKGNKVTSTLVRKSFFSFGDYGRKVESEIQVSGKSKLEISDFDWRTFRDAQIITDWPAFTTHGTIWTNETLRATAWKSDPNMVEHERSVLKFPLRAEAEGVFKGKHVRLLVIYSDYRLFRTSVAIREVE